MAYLKNTWYAAGRAEEASQQPFARTFLETPVVIFRLESGELTALDNNCPHRFAPLSQGKLIGDTIQCPYHGLRFDRTGKCVAVPMGGEPPPGAKLRSYPIAERYTYLWIWMGDPELADPAKIPDFAYIEDDKFGWFDGYLYAQGNYQLLVDNLLDLVHAEFLHPLLSSDGWSGRNKQTTTVEGDTINVLNVAEDDNIIPIMKLARPDLADIGTTKHIERWNPPSLLRLSVEYYAEGENIIIPSAHFLTPETASTTHYFIRGGHNVGGGNPAVTEGMKIGAIKAFETEDVPMIEAQQKFLGNADLLEKHPAILRTDGAAIRARRHLAKLMREEMTGISKFAETA